MAKLLQRVSLLAGLLNEEAAPQARKCSIAWSRCEKVMELLVDLRDLAERQGRKDQWSARLGELRKTHAKKPSFLKRLDVLEP